MFTAATELNGLQFSKGHGTRNDFVLYADPLGKRPLSAAGAAWLCNRRSGIGGDGAIRAVLVEHADFAVASTGDQLTGSARWLMDYRNADGSLAEMCGNGLRVFVAFLRQAGLLTLADGEVEPIATRGGIFAVRRQGEMYEVNLGKAPDLTVPALSKVTVPGLPGERDGVLLHLPNPHVVVAVTQAEKAKLDLTVPPILVPAPASGANVEFVTLLKSADCGQAELRVYERGVGETESCGTGVAAAASVLRAALPHQLDRWQISVPGGDLTVRFAEGNVYLAGPAVLVAEGVIRADC
ncbi:MAG: diaminopimelate epimerase [Bifidobacteriaceae bacterium]|jgi:diaminopimelate epimerase|nr:diaminopimelate epimerase [Bifidobacteriaceae bacterium]